MKALDTRPKKSQRRTVNYAPVAQWKSGGFLIDENAGNHQHAAENVATGGDRSHAGGDAGAIDPVAVALADALARASAAGQWATVEAIARALSERRTGAPAASSGKPVDAPSSGSGGVVPMFPKMRQGSD